MFYLLLDSLEKDFDLGLVVVIIFEELFEIGVYDGTE